MFYPLPIIYKSSACRASTGHENGLHSHQRAITLLLSSFLSLEAPRSNEGNLYVMAYYGWLRVTESLRRYADTEENAFYGGRTS